MVSIPTNGIVRLIQMKKFTTAAPVAGFHPDERDCPIDTNGQVNFWQGEKLSFHPDERDCPIDTLTVSGRGVVEFSFHPDERDCPIDTEWRDLPGVVVPFKFPSRRTGLSD